MCIYVQKMKKNKYSGCMQTEQVKHGCGKGGFGSPLHYSSSKMIHV